MNKILLFMFLTLFSKALFCQEKKDIPPSYPGYVGDIEFNKKMDREDFELCSGQRIYQYFNNSGGVEYEGGKLVLEKVFAAKYHSETMENETGLIRINFVVNYKGETDRFRLIAMDENYHEKIFPCSITDQLMDITKSLTGWQSKRIRDKPIDYYQYLIFKIENGQLKNIFP